MPLAASCCLLLRNIDAFISLEETEDALRRLGMAVNPHEVSLNSQRHQNVAKVFAFYPARFIYVLAIDLFK